MPSLGPPCRAACEPPMKAATSPQTSHLFVAATGCEGESERKKKKEKKTNLPPMRPDSKPDAVPPPPEGPAIRPHSSYCAHLLLCSPFFFLLLLTTLLLFPLRPLKSLLHPALPPREGTNYRRTDGQITGLEGKWKRAGGEFGGWRVGGPVAR